MCALLFLAWTAEAPVALDPSLYSGLWRSPLAVLGPLFESLPGIHLTAWQLAVFALAPLCLAAPGVGRRARPLDMAILVSLACLAVTFGWGLLRGGSAYQAYYQLWRFLAGLLVALILVGVTTSPRHLKALGTTIVAAALVRGTLAMYFFWGVVRGGIDPAPPYMTTHDDSLLFVAGLLVVLSWALARRTVVACVSALAVSSHLLYAITLNNRRLAWIELILSVALIYFILPRGKVQRRVNQLLVVAGPLVLAYVLAGWSRPEPVFAPVAALSSASSYEDASALAREEEIRNLLYTLARNSNPLMGTGWGKPYQKLTSVYANFVEWWQYEYLPHNSLLGVAVFGGFAGLFGIWLVVPVAAFLAMRGYRGATSAVTAAAAMSALCILPAYGVQCYGDIGFQSLTCNLILAVALAAGGKAAAWAVAQPDAGKAGSRRALLPAAPIPSLEACSAASMPAGGSRPEQRG